MAGRGGEAVQKVNDLDVGKLAVSAATSVVKKYPVSVSVWVVGLLLAAFAGGFSVDDATQESYSMTLRHAEEVDRAELNTALRNLHRAEDAYTNAKGWFWSCDAKCQKAHDKANMARAEVNRVQDKRDKIMREARKEVGIWSVFGVRDVRASFWTAWKSGKDFAARYTMMDAIFMMVGGREETMMEMIFKIVMQYIINLTMGLVGAFFFFIYNVYHLIVSYGEPTLSGLAFFLLVLVAAVATVGSYLFAIYGTVAGGGLYLIKQAAKQAAVEGGQAGARRPRQVQYGGGRPYYRPHSD
mmetsp:Transcript_113515/g.353853  ORF Transcript_113515/g.353853 Transcript_113515/m.353853 type:complete len:298 (-) Transcript_113515:81-974(-)|eukprot:CAMPEP_0204604586 /NCGR_PEP_ID=MMETSP0661-20131031/57960_1 /ASSEMBLY_ACC=CAM_ASM_000606 /TAXON_ID=109239 /ORGANISM="Alexandrium margalefi, Strain AMGDE01CS-322" /LENGTH=297 /DNA_ID=CAMNT_0051615761 /DNA_START=55 /DNA_END=948 /DNA_ORIENTATION=-